MKKEESRTPALRNEDWWACFIGWLILVLAALGVLPKTPEIGTWKALSEISPTDDPLATSLIFFATTAVMVMLSGFFLRFDLKKFLPGYFVIFGLGYVAMIISRQAFFAEWGISHVLIALVLGLVISNVFKTPKWMEAARQTEYYVKIGLVCMGATIVFSAVIKAGTYGMLQALVVATAVWFMTYFICRRFGVHERLSAIIATANSICGVSATIAAGDAMEGDSKEVSYMVAWVLVCSVVLIVILPPIAIAVDMPPKMAGAWLGGVIDNTGAVIAAGEIFGGRESVSPGDAEAAVNVAGVVKMAQNILLGFVAFLMALWATMHIDRKEAGEKASLTEAWYRFPKFVIGFVVASLVVSVLIEPNMDASVTKAVRGVCRSYRSWFFVLCFVSIGLETNFRELVSVGGGRPAIAYWISQGANALWTLLIAWLIWGGVLFGDIQL